MQTIVFENKGIEHNEFYENELLKQNLTMFEGTPSDIYYSLLDLVDGAISFDGETDVNEDGFVKKFVSEVNHSGGTCLHLYSWCRDDARYHQDGFDLDVDWCVAFADGTCYYVASIWHG